MLSEILTITAPIFICAMLGFGWAKLKHPFDSHFVSSLVMSIGTPCLIIGTLGKVELPKTQFTDILIASCLVLALTGAASTLLCRTLNISIRTFVTPLTFPNTGNIGLPLCLFAFGQEGLAIALGVFLVVCSCQFSIGVALMSGSRSLLGIVRSPTVYASIIAIYLVYSGHQLPSWLQNTMSLLGGLTIPLMLITLGVSLAQLRVTEFYLSSGLAIARLVIGFLIGVFVCEILNLEGVTRGIIIILSSMPSAVFNYLLATRYQRDPEVIAGLVVMSTLIGFILLPPLLWWLLPSSS